MLDANKHSTSKKMKLEIQDPALFQLQQSNAWHLSVCIPVANTSKYSEPLEVPISFFE